jgi:hypothetical protein
VFVDPGVLQIDRERGGLLVSMGDVGALERGWSSGVVDLGRVVGLVLARGLARSDGTAAAEHKAELKAGRGQQS